MECSIINPALALLMKHLVIGQRQKAPNFSAFHWSAHGCLVSIGQDFVTTRVVHLPKRTETNVITESDQSGPYHQLLHLCTKFMECFIINPALALLMKHLVIGQRQNAPNFSAFHWSAHGRLVSIVQNFVTTRVVYLPKRTETSVITESYQSGPNHQLLQLCTARTAWSDSGRA